ncbi:MAG TPA: hypothetical protein VJN68_06330 [Burkholderiaceae bacterium]|nr:hypothetical protein [Burkholderiaceae bacterium]
MDYSLHLNRWHYRRPDWLAAVVAGLAGGAVLMVLELLWSAVSNETGPWRASQLVAAIALGPDVLQSSAATFQANVVGTALVTHYALGVVFGLVFAVVATGFGIDRQVPATLLFGALFGALLYLFDFHGMVRFFPWFVELRGWAMGIEHLVFGMVAALLYAKLERQGRTLAGRNS